MPSWIGTRWLEALATSWRVPSLPLEAAKRLQVRNLVIVPGQVSGHTVDSARRHNAVLWSETESATRWAGAIRHLEALGALPSGPVLEAMLRASGLRLFPRRLDVLCTCTGAPCCAHVTALALASAAEFDRDPASLFAFRGAPAEDLGDLRDLAPEPPPLPGRQPPVAEPARPSIPVRTFWEGPVAPPTPAFAAQQEVAAASEPAVARRDLPRRIQAPQPWDKRGVIPTAMASVCTALAEWSAPPAAALEGMVYGFTPEEAQALRSPPPAPTPPRRRAAAASALPVCRACGAPAQRDWRFCAQCGRPLEATGAP